MRYRTVTRWSVLQLQVAHDVRSFAIILQGAVHAYRAVCCLPLYAASLSSSSAGVLPSITMVLLVSRTKPYSSSIIVQQLVSKAPCMQLSTQSNHDSDADHAAKRDTQVLY